MSNAVVDDFAAPWTADPSGLWVVTSASAAARFGADGLGLDIRATAGAGPAPAPFAERNYAPALDLRGSDELRFWLRSTRPGDGTATRPVYLELEATRDPPAGSPWRRAVPVSKPNRWQLVTLWLGDMAPALRQAVGFLRLRSLDGTAAFAAQLDDLIETAPRPIEDCIAAVVDRIDGVYSVDVAGVATPVPTILDVPENPGPRAEPYVLVTPWAVTAPRLLGAALDETDNVTAGGVHVRPAPARLQLSFRLDVFAAEWEQKAAVLDRLVVDLLEPLVVNGLPVALEPYQPSDEEWRVTAGRTPLFYRAALPVEVGVRRPHDLAVPFLYVGHGDRTETETVQL